MDKFKSFEEDNKKPLPKIEISQQAQDYFDQEKGEYFEVDSEKISNFMSELGFSNESIDKLTINIVVDGNQNMRDLAVGDGNGAYLPDGDQIYIRAMYDEESPFCMEKLFVHELAHFWQYEKERRPMEFRLKELADGFSLDSESRVVVRNDEDKRLLNEYKYTKNFFSSKYHRKFYQGGVVEYYDRPDEIEARNRALDFVDEVENSQDKEKYKFFNGYRRQMSIYDKYASAIHRIEEVVDGAFNDGLNCKYTRGEVIHQVKNIFNKGWEKWKVDKHKNNINRAEKISELVIERLSGGES